MELAVGERIIVLIDMDCFYVQVEQKLCPEYDNKPCSVVQYQPWKGGGIIAVNYEARAFGVKRGMRGDDAKTLCPEIHNFRVPEVRNKADLTRYREAGASVIDVLCEYCDCVERASVDEAYLDLTPIINEKFKNSDIEISCAQIPNTYVIGWNKDNEGDDVQSWLHSIRDDHMFNDKKLAVAAQLVEEIRAAVYDKTKFKCSAGIAHNKMLAKLACGIHKPNKQTVMPQSSVPILFNVLPIHKVRNLGGKFGNEVKEKLKVSTMGDLMKFSELQFQNAFGEKSGSWLYLISRGIEHDTVVARQLPKSVGCGKNFNGDNILNTKSKVSHWLLQLSLELDERLQKDQLDNRRFARSLTVTVRSKDDQQATASISRTYPIHIYNAQKFANDALKAIQKLNIAPATSLFWKPPLINLTLAASKFEDQVYLPTHSIHSYFANSHCNEENQHENSLSDTSLQAGSVKTKSKEDNLKQKNDKKLGTINTYFSKSCNSSIECHDKKNEEDILDDVLTMVNDSERQSDPLEPNFVSNEICENQDSSLHDKPVLNSFFAKKIDKKIIVENCETLQVNDEKFSTENELDSPLDNQQQSNTVNVISSRNINNNKEIRPEKSSNVEEDSQDFLSNSDTGASIADLIDIKASNVSDTLQNKNELPEELLITCTKCHEKFPVWDEQEHSDFHLAIDIQSEFQNKVVASSFSNINTPNAAKKIARKRTSNKTSNVKTKLPKQNTIDMFMK